MRVFFVKSENLSFPPPHYNLTIVHCIIIHGDENDYYGEDEGEEDDHSYDEGDTPR